MIEMSINIGDVDRPLHVWQSEEDTPLLKAWADQQDWVALDTETSGLDPYAPDFGIRLVQFGNTQEAWVIPFSDRTRDLVAQVVNQVPHLVIHNASYDLQVLSVAGVGDLEEMWQNCSDTLLMAHLLDPRSKNDGGSGHKLEQLTAHYLGFDAERYKDDLFAHFKEMGWRSAGEGYRTVDMESPVFLRYAGADVLLLAWLYEAALEPLILSRGFSDLKDFEHSVGRIASGYSKRGLLVDVAYAESLLGYFDDLEDTAKAIAKGYGITKLGSTAQVGEVLTALGANLTERTPSGNPKVDKAVLEALADNHKGQPLGLVAEAVINGKNASKWRSAYVENTLDRLDAGNRVHPNIRTLQARTSRMSITAPAVQTLPAGDHHIRSMFIAEPGHVIASVDYSQIELCVVAAMADEDVMLQAIAEGESLHDTTARQLFGEGFTKEQRGQAKAVNFARCYGAGATTVARQTGISVSEASAALKRFDQGYPKLKRYSRNLVERAERGAMKVSTPSGRVLPLDRERSYAATNYAIQSTAADVLKQAMIYLDEEGLGKYALLPIHDEVLFSLPEEEADVLLKRIEEVMSMDFMGKVFLKAEGEILGKSWGEGYRG